MPTGSKHLSEHKLFSFLNLRGPGMMGEELVLEGEENQVLVPIFLEKSARTGNDERRIDTRRRGKLSISTNFFGKICENRE